MKQLFRILILCTLLLVSASCVRTESIETIDRSEVTAVPTTKALGDKSPMISVYVETNDVNPLNAGDYYFEDTGETFFDIVELFAANIVKEEVYGQIRPVLTLNDKLTNILENGGVEKYVRPLQDMGIRVHLTVIGHWSRIGLANMNSTQTTQFAEILAYTVEKYGLDGIGLNDEYANYDFTNSTSFSEIIIKLRQLLPEDKMITVYDWGYTNTISMEAAKCIDYAYHGYYGSYSSNIGIPGITKERWSPISFNLGSYISQSTTQRYAERAKEGGFGAAMFFNLRTRDDRDPMPVFQGMANGAYDARPVACEDGNRPRDVVIVRDWYRINYDMVKNK